MFVYNVLYSELECADFIGQDWVVVCSRIIAYYTGSTCRAVITPFTLCLKKKFPLVNSL